MALQARSACGVAPTSSGVSRQGSGSCPTALMRGPLSWPVPL